jgi:hypothetical protein
MATATHAGSVQFLHYGETGNLGDLLCSPRHYFDFESDRRALIVGGGASNNFFCGRARRQPASVRIAWGIGQSWTFGAKASPVDRLLKSTVRRLTYAKASTRDPSLVSDQLPLVPCVSVFHPVTEIPAGREVVVLLNANEKVSGAPSGKTDAPAFGDALVATNALGAEDFLGVFRRAGTIITNSYHAAYWGLLSGRSVHVIGYSSKFTNLAALFGFPESAVIRVGRGDGAALNRALAHCAARAPLRLERPEQVRSRFRERNLDFARALGAVGVSASLKRAYAKA